MRRQLLEEKKLRRFIRSIVREEAQKAQGSKDPVPGDAPPAKQLHVFDFDDTLGVTQDSNGVMLYKDGEPAWKSAKDAEAWINDAGISGEDLLKGPGGQTFEQPEGIDGFAAYVSSGVLPKIKAKAGGNVKISPNKPTAQDGEAVVFDFSPSASAKSAEPIKDTIGKVKKVDSEGGETAIVTARAGESGGKPTKNFAGKDVKISVEKDLTDFMQKQGAPLNMGVHGTSGANKGEFIKNNLLDPMPDEIHFYDDDGSNIDKVKGALAGKVPAELFLYGPGKYQEKASDPNQPNQKYPAAKEDEKKTQAESIDLSRWKLLAGIR